jgi:cellulose synthase/poly-beta-1,6-N-acetylglucosamine synthase-like glycosyltransferase
VRFRRGLFFNFNGTAGLWRKEAIVSSGGWEDDTVTEDLDISYRAQLRGWKFVYLHDLRVPSELPSTIASFRSQQQRWAKGSIQTARKILPKIIRSDISRRTKIEAGFHLLSNLGWFCGMIITLTLFPAIILRTEIGPYQMLRIDLPLFIGTTCMLLFFFFVYACYYQGKKSIAYVALLPFFSIAIAPSIALSVIKGIFSWGGLFERTPKFGIHGVHKFPKHALIYLNNTAFHLCLTFVFLIYSVMPFFYAVHRGTWFALPLLALFPMGFLMVILKELSEIHIRTEREKKA